MAQVRVWNLTDDPNLKMKAHNRMVLGRTVRPGHAVRVDEAKLHRAHKTMAEVEAGILFIGERPPASYMRMKNPPRAQLADDVIRTHAPGRKQVADAAKAAAPVVDKVVVEEKVEAKVEKAEESAKSSDSEESSDDSSDDNNSSSGFGRKKKRR